MMRIVVTGLLLSAGLLVFVPHAAAECPPSGGVVYAGTCEGDQCPDHGSTGVWVGRTFLGYTSSREVDDSCAAPDSFCFFGILFYGTYPDERVGLC